jgi:uncharacterized protein involved in exopolysaccharide biosynthesis
MEINAEQNYTLSLKDSINSVWKNKWILLITTMTFLSISLVIALVTPRLYKCTSKIITRTNSNGSDNQLSGLAALAGVNMYNGVTSQPSIYFPEIIQDYLFCKKVIEKKWPYKGASVNISDFWKFKVDTSRSNWKCLFEMGKINKLRHGGYIRVSEDKKTGLITLKTFFFNPEIAYQLNIFIFNMFEDYIQNNLKSQAKEKRTFIESRLSEINQELELSEKEFAKFKQENVANYAPIVAMNEQQLMRKLTINQEMFIQAKKQYEIARVEEKKDMPLMEVICRPELPISADEPNRKLILMFGFTIGLFFGLLIALSKRWYEINYKGQ